LALMGCPAAKDRHSVEVAAALDQTMNLLDQLTQGYAGPDIPEAEMAVHRRDLAAQAVTQLEQLNNKGSAAQQHVTSYVLADLYVLQARDSALEAGQSWAALAGRAATLVTSLLKVDRGVVEVARFETDESALRASLAEFEGQLADDIVQLEDSLQQYRQRVGQVQREAERVDQQRREVVAEAQREREEAFVADQGHGYDLEVNAIESQRRAATLMGAVEAIELQSQVLGTEQAILEKQLVGLQQLRQQLQDDQDAARQRDEQAVGQRQSAVDRLEDYRQELVEALEDLAKRFEQTVAEPFERAAEQAERAVAVSEDAGTLGDGPAGRDAAQLNRLSVGLAHAQVLAEHVAVLGSYGRTVGMLAGQARTLMPRREAFFQTNADTIRDRQSQLIEQVSAVLDHASELALELTGSGSDDQVVELATRQGARAAAYRQQVADSRL